MDEPIDPETPLADTERVAWFRRPRWRYAGAAFLFGVAESALAVAAGFRATIGARDVTTATALLIELSFAGFGYLIGVAVEGRRQARARTEALTRARARLAQAETLASLGQLASAITHEVRNPLAILRSLAQNLAEEVEAAADVPRQRVTETCDALVEEIDRLAHVTARLRDFVRPPVLRTSPVVAAEIVARVASLAEHMLDGRGSQVVTEPPQRSDRILSADADLLVQVLLALVANAAEATEGVGAIRLGWSEAAGPGGTPTVSFFVADEGPGVTPEDRDRVFEPFFTTRPAGHGLGLAVARQIVEAHGGSIFVEDAEPSGACFRVALPAPMASSRSAA